MKSLFLVSFGLLCALSQAHMGMTLAALPAREKAVHGDNYRAPHGTKICQGLSVLPVVQLIGVFI